MKRLFRFPVNSFAIIFAVWIFCHAPHCFAAQPSAAANAAFNSYIATTEARLDLQHRSPNFFLAPLPAADESRLHRGEFVIEQLTPANPEPPGALLHHWRATAFAPNAHAADFDRLMRNIAAYPQHFAPQVTRAVVLDQNGDHLRAFMRLRQKHVMTVVMDTAYDITFGRLDAQRGYTLSRSIRMAEIDAAGTAAERTLSPNEDHGFLWRLNTYWSFEERDGGLYLQVESVSLSRSIPTGLGWAVGPYVESIPRESLEFTLRSTCDALRK